MNEVLNRLKKWSEDWMVDLNPEKTKCMLVNQAINFLKSRPVMGNEELEFVDCHKDLGVILNSKCTWLQHVDMILDKANRRLGVLRGLKYRLNGDSLRKIYISHIPSVLEYTNVVWNNCGEILSHRIDKVQNEATRIITGLPVYYRSDILLREAGIEALKIRRERAVLVVFFKIIMDYTPKYLKDLLPNVRHNVHGLNLRIANNFCQFDLGNSANYARSFYPMAVSKWNDLPWNFRSANSLGIFRSVLHPFSERHRMPALYSKMGRRAAILFTRLKCNCSSLNHHLSQIYLSDDVKCRCNLGAETTGHFIFDCPFYDVQRESLIYSLSQLDLPSFALNLLIERERIDNVDKCLEAQKVIQKFIIDSNRF